MREDWKEVKLGILDLKFIDGDRGKNYPKQHDLLEKGYCLFLSAKNITSDGFQLYDLAFINEEKDSVLRKGKIKDNDIIITTRGTIGNVCIYNNKIPFENVRINSGMLIIRNESLDINTDYLYQFLKSDIFRERTKTFAFGAAVPQLPISTLVNIKINLPPLKTQKKIASILSGYDDLIENNLKRIKILEEMAQQTYEEWFVRMRFPGHQSATINPATGLPEGWEKVKLGDLGEIVTGKTPSTSKEEYYNGDIPFIKTPDMNGSVYVIETNQYLTQQGSDVQKNKILDKNDIVVSCIGSAGAYALVSRPSQFNQQINAIRFNKDEYVYFTFCYAKGLKEILQALGSNGATMTNVNKGKFEQIEIILPNKELLAKFHQFAKPCFESILNLQNQSQRLREARDILLPRLMMGMVEV